MVWALEAAGDARTALNSTRAQAVLLAWLLAAAVTAARPRAGLATSIVAAAALPPLVCAAVIAVVGDLAAALPVSNMIAASVAVVCLGLAAAVHAWPGRLSNDPRRTAVEACTACTAVVAVAVLEISAAWSDLWLVLLLLGVGAAAIATTDGRARLGWVSGVLLTGSTWARLDMADVDVVEAYTLPPAAALIGLGVLQRRPARTATRPSALLSGGGLALVPSVIAAAGGSPVRPALLLTTAGALAAAGWASTRRPSLQGLAAPALLAATGVAAATTGVRVASTLIRLPLAPVPWTDVETWSLPAAALVATVAWIAGRETAVPEPVRRGLAPLVTLVAAAPSLGAAAFGGAWSSWRAGAVLAVAAGVALVTPWLDGRLAAGVRWSCVAAAALAVGVGLRLDVTAAPEWWTTPFGVLLLALGAYALRRRTRPGSWRALGPGLAASLLPSLYLATTTAYQARIVALAVVASGILLAGARLRLQAPTLIGAGVLAVHLPVQVFPVMADIYRAVPAWAVLSAVGLAVLLVGATYESRVRDLRAAQVWLAAMR
jgi:hypothetical protein